MRRRPNTYFILLILITSLFAVPKMLAQDASTETTAAEATKPANPPDNDLQESTQPVQVDPTASDDDIETRLHRIMEASERFEDVSVRVEAGIVFLDGVAQEQSHQSWAANMSRNVEGVVAVVNNITVRERSSFNLTKSSDHVITSLRSIWRDFLERLPLITVGMLVLVVTWGVDLAAASLVRRSARRAHLRSSLQDLLVQLSTFATWVLGITVAATVIFPGMTPAKLLTVLGLGSVALGFAFKDIFENFFAGILILWRFPFDKGDFVECGEIAGKVEDISVSMSL